MQAEEDAPKPEEDAGREYACYLPGGVPKACRFQPSASREVTGSSKFSRESMQHCTGPLLLRSLP
ncbi:hypothetical protein [Oryza sativa Japonica Group]|uniref:Uncharacterized protein n=1 Tax=Oryza sativa subsp. japonica TaxID=39947 RepID=Q5N8W2_ORYSJ|nr:hypothetical protein [Oryza sativa Japonica Group]